jgi:chromate transporter
MLFGEVREIGAYGLTVHMPVLTSVDWPAVALAAVAAIATFRLKLGMIWTLALCCVLGVLYYLAFA